MNENITLEDIQRLASCGTRVRVLNDGTGKLIIDDLNSLARSKDKRQAAKWMAYKDAPVSYMHPGTIFQRGTVFSDSVYVIIEVTIGGFYDAECRKRYKEILKGDGDAKP